MFCVKVKVMEVDASRKRIALSIKQTEVPSSQNTKSTKPQIKPIQNFKPVEKELKPSTMVDALEALKNKFR